MWATNFHTHTKQQARLYFCTSYSVHFWIVNWKTKYSAQNDNKHSLKTSYIKTNLLESVFCRYFVHIFVILLAFSGSFRLKLQRVWKLHCEILLRYTFKMYRCPATGRGGPRGSGRLRCRVFLTFGTMKVVRSSSLRTGRLYPQEYPDTYF
jgi:hypothetical protein